MVLRRFIQFLIVLCTESPINLILYFKNDKLKWSYDSNNEKATTYPQNTSISDSHDSINFLQLCALASSDENFFANFRSNTDFSKILEHVEYWRGHKYASKIRKYRLSELEKFMTRYDSIGAPAQYKFRSFPKCSPSLLRYISVYLEMKEYFGSLSNLIITEIGVGYGGQAVTISHFDKPLAYYLYDLPEVLGLAQKFISTQKIPLNQIAHDGRNPITVKSDLVISNYAFSELERSLQLQYLQNILLKSSMGYMTWNNLSFKSLGGLSVDEIKEAIPGSQILPETPLTAHGNLVIVWGHKKN